jgi:hypothetical protein
MDQSPVTTPLYNKFCCSLRFEPPEPDLYDTCIESIILDHQSKLKNVYEESRQELVRIRKISDTKAKQEPLSVLRHALSARPVVSTTSAFAERMEDLKKSDSKTTPLRVIGRGTFGTVFEIPGTVTAIKKTWMSPDILHKEFNIGRKVSEACYHYAVWLFAKHAQFDGLLVPRVPWYSESHGATREPSTTRWWNQNKGRFPLGNGDDAAGPLFIMERIMPLPEHVRTSLIHHFFKPDTRKAALRDPINKDCLIRPYLGARFQDLGEVGQASERDNLRNFPLYVDELEELHMDPIMIAREMALGLAVAHWKAGIDMTDVEFVIGSRPRIEKVSHDHSLRMATNRYSIKGPKLDVVPTRSTMNLFSSAHLRNQSIQLWILDFDKANEARVVDATRSEDISKLVTATRANDPYYPTMIPDSKLEWAVMGAFTSTYVSAGKAILEDQSTALKAVEVSDAAMDNYLNRPRDVMKEWVRQERLVLGKEKVLARLNRAKEGGWLPACFTMDDVKRGK